ncbi:MAG: hypothetical protein HN413_02550 [Chloroflexi bacterium]|jgi:hypothetical protein|nr:hypothetical protein [Chloroflexota bacterium]
MSPRIRIFTILTTLLVLFSSLACVTVTRALGLENVPDLPIATDNQTDKQQGFNDEGDYEYDAEGRPILSGTEEILDSEHFRIHYTSKGRDAVASASYVDEVAQALEHVWKVEIDQFGWAAPPPDDGIGGDDRYDVYLQEILWDGTFGYVEGGEDSRYRSDGQVGDNPNTAAVEERASASFMVLDNDYADLEEFAIENYTVTSVMQSTVAHEFNHAIQFGYDGEEPADWLWEATATWMQDEVYDDVNDGIEDLYAVFKSPDSCQLAYGGEERVEDENHWYGEWIFLRYISENYGHQTVRTIWEQAAALDSYAALEAALNAAGTTLDETLRGFSLALLTREFEEGAAYPVLRLESTATGAGTFTPVDGVGQMAADYIEILANGVVTVKLDDDALTPLLVGIAGGQASVFEFNGAQASVDASAFDHLYLIVINPERAADEYDCYFSEYSVDISAGGQTQPAAETLSATNFSAPEVEELMDPAEYWGDEYGNYESIEAPAELTPAYLPAGYEFYEAYLMQAAEFGEDAYWYAPDGGELTVVDFYGPGDEDFISVSSASTSFTNLDEFLTDADWEPLDEEWFTFNSVDVLIEDVSDEYGPYSYATYILGDQFIVVEGNLSVDEMAKVVESMLK